VKRRGVLDVLERYVAEKNSATLKPSPPQWASGRSAYDRRMNVAKPALAAARLDAHGQPGDLACAARAAVCRAAGVRGPVGARWRSLGAGA